MRTGLTYHQVVQLLLKPRSDESLHHGVTLLLFVHEVMEERHLTTENFVFTQFNEGHILVSAVNGGGC